jgi:uncharacterized Zn-binding protein involved in type VI secretion
MPGATGRAAARVGDPTTHGIPLGPGPGSPDVRIDGRPAWRVTDLHACPLVTRSVPHGSGRVVTGSATVLVNGGPAARRGDAIREAGAISEIAAGEPTVRIG